MEILIYKILKSGFFGFFDRSDMRIYGKILISGLNEKYPLDEGNVKFSLFFFFNFFQLRKSRNKKKLFFSLRIQELILTFYFLIQRYPEYFCTYFFHILFR